MEASGAALRGAPANFGPRFRRENAGDPLLSCSRRSFRISERPTRVSDNGRRFSDEGHLTYYVSPVRCGARKKEEKRRAKLVRDLSEFHSMGFGVEAGKGLAGEVKGKMISEAAELLLAQLKEMQAQEKEMRMKRKEEKAAKKASRKAAKMKSCAEDDSSSSSSSDSSDSECEPVVKMSSVTTAAIPEPKSEDLAIPTAPPSSCNSTALALELTKTGEDIEEIKRTLKLGPECSSTTTTSSASRGCRSNTIPLVDRPMDKIEVCMGGKCKKSGGLQLLEELERNIGVEGAVVGCKCMGKCRDGPNVRVVNHCTEEDNVVQDVNKLLCIGVGLDDVGAIVSNFFRERKSIGLMTA